MWEKCQKEEIVRGACYVYFGWFFKRPNNNNERKNRHRLKISTSKHIDDKTFNDFCWILFSAHYKKKEEEKHNNKIGTK